MRQDALAELHASLDGRLRPEDTAELIIRALGPSLNLHEHSVLEGVARYAHRRRGGFSSMSADFIRPATADRQIASAARLFGAEPVSMDAALPWAAHIGETIHWQPGHSDFKCDRLNRDDRRAANLGRLSKRQYNKRFRALARLESKMGRIDVEATKRRLIIVGRSMFAAEIPLNRFLADANAACFIAYWTARKNLRRMFSLAGRDNPFDETCQLLFDRCERADLNTDWVMIALAYPSPVVLERLDDDAKGNLLGCWVGVMREASLLLQGAWSPSMDKRSMVVRRGNDSSTWNTMATAFNTARAAWLNLLHSIGGQQLLDVMCPGKVMRLMAADLAWWHTREGGELDPDTYVWSALPFPWEVLDGTEPCTRGDIEKACDHVGIDPVEKGWTAPRATGAVATFKPTPELVHGVAIADPVWAALLRRGGIFSGQRVRPELLEGLTPEAIADVVTSDLPHRTPPAGL